jgi:hypothetical protein
MSALTFMHAARSSAGKLIIAEVLMLINKYFEIATTCYAF